MQEQGKCPEYNLGMVLEDARARQEALVGLILFTDQQAMSLLSLYTTVGIAAGGAALSALGKSPLIPAPAGYGLFCATTMMLAGVICCFRAMRRAHLTLPGRGAEFWRSALYHEPDEAPEVVSSYLYELEEIQTKDRETNRINAGWLRAAKLVGAVAPLVALLAVGAAYFFLSPS